MPFKVFLSYGTDRDEQITALRLQTLAAASGIHVFVPHRGDAKRNQLSLEVRRQIDRSDCVLAIMASTPGPALQAELNYALSQRKTVVPIVQQELAQPAFLKKFPRTFAFSPWNTGEVEAEIVDFLKTQRVSNDNQQAVGALVAIGLGLFLLLTLAKK